MRPCCTARGTVPPTSTCPLAVPCPPGQWPAAPGYVLSFVSERRACQWLNGNLDRRSERHATEVEAAAREEAPCPPCRPCALSLRGSMGSWRGLSPPHGHGCARHGIGGRTRRDRCRTRQRRRRARGPPRWTTRGRPRIRFRIVSRAPALRLPGRVPGSCRPRPARYAWAPAGVAHARRRFIRPARIFPAPVRSSPLHASLRKRAASFLNSGRSARRVDSSPVVRRRYRRTTDPGATALFATRLRPPSQRGPIIILDVMYRIQKDAICILNLTFAHAERSRT